MKHLKKLSREAQLFAFWRSIPAVIRNADYVNRVKGLEIPDDARENLMAIMNASSMKEFAEATDISYESVLKWNRDERIDKAVDLFNLHNNAMRFKQDIDYAFSKATIENADPARFKLWKQYFEGWVPKEGSVHQMKEEDSQDIQEKLRELAKKKDETISEGDNGETGAE